MFGDTEIGEHQRRMGIGGNEQQVLGLEISVHNVLAVQVIDGLEDVLHGLSGILFGELAIIADSVEELASGSELGDNVELLLALEPVLEGDDVWVVALLEQRELFNYHVVVSLEVFLDNDLDGHLFAGRVLFCVLDNTEGTGSQGLAKLVVGLLVVGRWLTRDFVDQAVEGHVVCRCS